MGKDRSCGKEGTLVGPSLISLKKKKIILIKCEPPQSLMRCTDIGAAFNFSQCLCLQMKWDIMCNSDGAMMTVETVIGHSVMSHNVCVHRWSEITCVIVKVLRWQLKLLLVLIYVSCLCPQMKGDNMCNSECAMMTAESVVDHSVMYHNVGVCRWSEITRVIEMVLWWQLKVLLVTQ